MKLLLHICCAPCSTEVFSRLSSEHHVTGYFYNPNIHSHKEYESRLKDLTRFSKIAGYEFLEGDYDMKEWFKATKGLKNEPEGGRRCETCFRIRLNQTARAAVEGGFEGFTTTLSISPHKNSRKINEIGRELSEKYGLRFIEADFKKKDGFKKSIEKAREHELKRQNYCGCVFSKLSK
jgi:predicted adenine nucleotide alpha hydrolase (AANH) superfamily ATPase